MEVPKVAEEVTSKMQSRYRFVMERNGILLAADNHGSDEHSSYRIALGSREAFLNVDDAKMFRDSLSNWIQDWKLGGNTWIEIDGRTIKRSDYYSDRGFLLQVVKGIAATSDAYWFTLKLEVQKWYNDCIDVIDSDSKDSPHFLPLVGMF